MEKVMNKDELEQKRDETYYKIIAAINDDKSRHGRGGLFDCGELGGCLIYWSKMRFHCMWYDLEKLPWEKNE